MSTSVSSNDSDYTDRDINDFMPVAPRARAAAISAEADKDDNAADLVPPRHPKTAAEEERLSGILSQSFLFSTVDSDDRETLIAAFEKVELPAGELLIREGEEGDCLYVVDEGLLEVFKAGRPLAGETVDLGPKVNVMHPGSTVGELALMYSTPRAATVKAANKALLWRLGRGTFVCIVQGAAMKKRAQIGETLASIPLLKACDSRQLIQLADAAATCELNPGEFAIREGDAGDAFYILLSGSAEALKNGGCVMRYAAGDFFGELALLNHAPRAASVVATTTAKLARFDVESFNRLLAPLQDTLRGKAQEYTNDPIDKEALF